MLRAHARWARWLLGTLALATLPGQVAACDQIFSIDEISPDASTSRPGPDAGGRDARGDGRVDGTASSDALLPDAKLDASAGDAGSDTALPPVDASGCGPAPTSALYVNAAAQSGGNGTMKCPFTTIGAALAFLPTMPTSPVTVNVAGGQYHEENLAVPVNATLQGAGTSGAGATTILGTSSATCTGSSYCALRLAPGGTVSGVIIQVPDDGQATYGILAEAATGDAGVPLVPIVRDVLVTGTTASGILAQGSITLGPGVTATQSTLAGLTSNGAGVVTIVGGSPASHFDDNMQDGIELTGSATLKFLGGTASHNKDDGVALRGSGAGHTITSLVANTNGLRGLVVTAHNGDGGTVPQSVVVEGSDLSQNQAGLYYDYGSAPPGTGDPLDIGTSIAAPGNVIFTASPHPTTGAGLLLCNARGKSSPQPAYADTFSSCMPSLALDTSCGAFPAAYVDVSYATRSDGGGAPLSGCACPMGTTATYCP